MDLVSHDMLNDNQAILSYLELILATPGLDKRTLDYLRKAVTHVRSSSLRIQNVNTIVNARKANTTAVGSSDLWDAVEASSKELEVIFPSRKVTIRRAQRGAKAPVTGGNIVKELLVTIMESVVKLDPGTDVVLDLKVSEDPGYGKRGWTVTIEDPRVKLPAVVRDTDIDSVHTKDSSLAPRVSGLLFAKMAADALGGDFDIQPSSGAAKGASFVLKLRRAEGQ